MVIGLWLLVLVIGVGNWHLVISVCHWFWSLVLVINVGHWCWSLVLVIGVGLIIGIGVGVGH